VLYPLELYVAALRVERLHAGLYHFDPLATALSVARDSLGAEEVAFASLSTYPEIVRGSAAIIFVAAVFGRTRFKEGCLELHIR
jgi:hypothetical protein